ncbi:MAG: fibronectin type III domain-containing protein [Candidatus Riflebacteria bacterium]|nr:fibronectin type III domain-containing protein [Candidatus Riflebacteria bacterium]
MTLSVTGCGSTAAQLEISSVATAVEADQVTISWRMSRSCFAAAELWDAAQPGAVRRSGVRSLAGTEYRARVTGLLPDRTYCFRIVAGPAPDLGEVTRSSSTHTIRTRKTLTVSEVAVAVSGQSATVTWKTDQPSDTTVIFGRTDEYESRKSNPDQRESWIHTVNLTGLEPLTTYRLRIVSKDPRGQASETKSQEVMFQTTGGVGTEVGPIMPRQGPKTN